MDVFFQVVSLLFLVHKLCQSWLFLAIVEITEKIRKNEDSLTYLWSEDGFAWAESVVIKKYELELWLSKVRNLLIIDNRTRKT